MDKEIFIGRQQELKAIHLLMDKKRNLVVFGEEGVGKSAIVRRVLSDSGSSFLLFSAGSMTLKESLVNFILSSQNGKNDIGGKNILSLKRVFYPLLKRNPEYIIFDQLGRVGPKFCSFFEYLLDKEIPLLVVSRGVRDDNIGHLRMMLFNFEKVEIANFDKENTIALVEQYVNEYKLNLCRQDDFAMEVFHFSKGNPKIIKELCSLARNGKYQKEGRTDVKLIDLDRRIQEISI
jgi:hypothetical protein